jgi:hypothetical protein
MHVRRKLLIFVILFLTIVLVGIVFPAFYLESPQLDTSFATSGPTTTPLQSHIFINRSISATPTTSTDANCTYHVYYWMERPEEWPTQVLLGDAAYSRDDILALYRSDSRDTSTNLILQLTAAFLNILSGAEMSVIEDTLVEANNWLTINPVGASLSEFNRSRGNALIALLEGYNIGLFGPGACAGLPPTPDLTAAAVFTNTPAPTQEPGQVETAMVPASPTPTPALRMPPPQPTVQPTNPPPELPTSTPLPTATQPPPPTATETIPQPPTETPPTLAPVVPSPTLAPTPTQALGDLPMPTLAPTLPPEP